MADQVSLTNRALATVGTRSQITSMTDGSTEALYANLLYAGLRDFMLREGDYDFSMKAVTVVDSGLGALVPWGYSYVYPLDTVRIRQLVPPLENPLDPEPMAWNIVELNSALYIATRQPASVVIYTTKAVAEDYWDAIFTEAFVRLLASSLAFALENRLEASNSKLSEALSFANIANLRDP